MMTVRLRPAAFGLAFGACLAMAMACSATAARAADAPNDAAADPAGALFASGAKALREGRAGDAITSLEALADRGVVDAAASYDRGLAYAMRVRVGAEVPGDLGRAAHGFEEARDLAHDPKLAGDAGRALVTVRGEVARRRMRAGDPAEVDPGPSLSRALAGLLPEDAWAAMAVFLSLAFAAGLFARYWLRGQPRVQIAGGVVAATAGPALLLAGAMTLAARHDRLNTHEAVVVTAGVRPTDVRGLTVPGASPIAEGARVEIVEPRGAFTRVRFGAIDVWVPSGSLRAVARND